jgi:hypothetical protein
MARPKKLSPNVRYEQAKQLLTDANRHGVLRTMRFYDRQKNCRTIKVIIFRGGRSSDFAEKTWQAIKGLADETAEMNRGVRLYFNGAL